MGKVRIETVKRTARELLLKHPNIFSINYQENKQALNGLIDVKAKKMRNRIAGYVTHLKKIQQKTVSHEENSKGEEREKAE